MKIIRFLSNKNEMLFGQYHTERYDQAYVLEGDLYEGLRPTARLENIRQLLPPVPPSNILALGLNYRRHAEETKMDTPPDFPILFMKATSSVVADKEPIVLPAAGPSKVDYEAELAVVIGKKAKNVTPEEAMHYVLGYTCANDVSSRDWQFERQKGQWVRGKSFDSFCPLGPCLITREDIIDPNDLPIRAILNHSEILQDSNTSHMIFNVKAIVSLLSQSMTLLPGTVILTGTPDGVGFTRDPPLFLKAGDHIAVEIDGIGRLSNPVVEELI